MQRLPLLNKRRWSRAFHTRLIYTNLAGVVRGRQEVLRDVCFVIRLGRVQQHLGGTGQGGVGTLELEPSHPGTTRKKGKGGRTIDTKENCNLIFTPILCWFWCPSSFNKAVFVKNHFDVFLFQNVNISCDSDLKLQKQPHNTGCPN